MGLGNPDRPQALGAVSFAKGDFIRTSLFGIPMLHSSSSWIWRMAWRDSRASRQRLLLFVSSITLGVAALMAISSFGVNLRQGLDYQAKTLLGADLVIRTRQPFSDAAEQLFRTIGGEQARETSFSSMVLLPKTGATRLAQVRALDVLYEHVADRVIE